MQKSTIARSDLLTPGMRLKYLRQMHNLSQSELADKVGELQSGKRICSVNQISYIERGQRLLSTEYARLFAKLFDVRPQWLLCDDDFMTEGERIGVLQEEYVKRSDNANNGIMALLDASLREVCAREGIPIPTLDNIPELLLIEAQLKDYAVSLMWNYVKWKNNSYVWSFLEQVEEAEKRKGKNNG